MKYNEKGKWYQYYRKINRKIKNRLKKVAEKLRHEDEDKTDK